MSLIQYRKPYSLLSELQTDLSRFFGQPVGSETSAEMATVADWSPAVDIIEEEDKYVIHADVPGMKPDDIEVTMEKGVLTLKGTRESVNKEEQDKYTRVERVHGTFFRRFTIPDATDTKNIEAKFKDGVLTITIPKGEEIKPRRIEIH
ncbi:MAG TPA: Hsp20/alpha crystallin family protein [Aeromonadales bacterium]|nr:Hsp20/alpha crystallin family protein [Aeromonadales bacterium]